MLTRFILNQGSPSVNHRKYRQCRTVEKFEIKLGIVKYLTTIKMLIWVWANCLGIRGTILLPPRLRGIFYIRSFSLLLQCPFPDWVRIFAEVMHRSSIYVVALIAGDESDAELYSFQHNHLFAMISEGSGYLTRTPHLNYKPHKECSFNYKILTLLSVGCYKFALRPPCEVQR